MHVHPNRQAPSASRKLQVLAAATLALLHPVTSALAQTWTGAVDNNFSNPANWSGGVAPVNDGTAAVTFPGSGPAVSTVLTTSTSVQSLTTTGTSLFGMFGAQTLSITSHIKASASAVIGATVNLLLAPSSAAFVTFDVDPSRELDINGTLSGGPLVKTGSGILLLNPYAQTNTYTGGTTIAAGTVIVRIDSDLGNLSDSLTFFGGPGTLIVDRRYGTLPVGADAGNFGRNIVFNAGATGTINAVLGNTIWSGVFSGAGDFTKTGAGVMTLTGAHTLFGTTRIAQGALTMDGSLPDSPVIVTNAFLGGSGSFGQSVTVTGTLSGSATFAGPVQVTGVLTGSQIFANTVTVNGSVSGSQSFAQAATITGSVSGSQTFAQPVTISSGILSGTQTFADTLTMGSGGRISGFTGTFGQLVTLSPGARLSASGPMVFPNGLSLAATTVIDYRVGSNDAFVITGGTLSGPVSGKITLNLSLGANYTPGIYTIFDFTSAASISSFEVSDFQFGTLLPGSTTSNYTLAISGNTLQLTAITLGAIPEPSTWAAIAGLAVLGVAVVRRRVMKPRATE